MMFCRPVEPPPKTSTAVTCRLKATVTTLGALGAVAAGCSPAGAAAGRLGPEGAQAATSNAAKPITMSARLIRAINHPQRHAQGVRVHYPHQPLDRLAALN